MISTKRRLAAAVSAAAGPVAAAGVFAWRPVDRIVVTHLDFDERRSEPREIGAEAIGDAGRIAAILGGFERPAERDCGTAKCPFDIRLDFLRGTRRTLVVRPASDGCSTIEVARGHCPAGGGSGAFGPGKTAVAAPEPFVRSHGKFEILARTRVSAGDRE